jgi:preprotein translocase subunit SecG
MYQVIIVVHVLLGLGVIGLILMQQGKGADAGAAFGSGSSGSVFGAQGAASFLSRTTAILATLFFTTSLTLAVLGGKQSKKVDLMDNVELEQKSVLDVPSANKTVTPTVENIPAVPSTPSADVPSVATDVKQTSPTSTDTKAEANGKAVSDKQNKENGNKKTDAVVVDEKANSQATEKKAKPEKKHHDSDKNSDKSAKKHKSDKKPE